MGAFGALSGDTALFLAQKSNKRRAPVLELADHAGRHAPPSAGRVTGRIYSFTQKLGFKPKLRVILYHDALAG